MKSKAILTAIFALGIFFTSCEQQVFHPSGNVTTFEKDITGFDALDVSNDFTVFVTSNSDAEGVRIEADDNFHDYIIVEKVGSTLRIGLERINNIRGKKTLNAYVSAKTLEEIEAGGDSKVYLENELQNEKLKISLRGDSQLQGPIQVNVMQADIRGDSKMTMDNMMQGDRFTLDIRGDSKFEGSVDVNEFGADIRGDSKVDLIGEAETASVEVRGDSQIRSYNFAIKALNINLSSDSEAYLTVTEELSVSASGDSVMNYKGNPTIDSKSLTGDSKLRKAD
ncbi:MAG: DUF2807 domain-containing protein [Saprospiraceae bacterium]|nr:DUF2807 domain-containing protein [Saprospiraceae bacterium]